MKLTIFKKIILVTSVVAVLFIGLVVPCFADSVGGDTYLVTPYFFPSSVALAFIDTSIASTTQVDTVGSFTPGDSGFVTVMNKTFENLQSGPSYIYASLMGNSTTSDFQIGYGVPYIKADFDFNLSLDNDIEGNPITEHVYCDLFFDDIFLPSNLINNNASDKLNWLGNWSVLVDSVAPTDCRLSFSVTYIDDDYKQVTKLVNTVYGVFNTSKSIGAKVYDILQSEVPRSARGRGVLINDLLVQYNLADSLKSLQINGEVKCTVPGALGAREALDRWVSYRTIETTTVVNNNTVIGNLVNGINDIWQLKLFGEFTIGALFSACVGVSLFIWILKIFAGG